MIVRKNLVKYLEWSFSALIWGRWAETQEDSEFSKMQDEKSIETFNFLRKFL